MKTSIRRKSAFLFLSTLLLLPSVLANAEAKADSADPPVFQNVSVHDPSVIKAGDTYYVFGSHLAAAKTKDFMQWTQISDRVSNSNPLIPNVHEELKEAFEWAESDTLWAPDVIQLEDGKFYMYYNACKGDSPRSALGVAIADRIEGPYRDAGIFLKSGMWGAESPDGKVYDPRIHPNVVDPHVFFDKEGKLWMTYGSYSGGIFIMEMDPTTGKPYPDQGYGKKLLGGNHSRIEGPYIMYNPETDFYYLFLSYGGLDANGGYNLRVARSENPDGPYVDAEGNDMIGVKANPALPLFDDKSIEGSGVKLMGNFLFDHKIGDQHQGEALGYVSPGHNSAYYDAETGKQFLIFHTRFPGKGEGHEIRVHQMFMNKEGWPVAAPFRYTGESLSKVTEKDVAGLYKMVNHGKDISADSKKSSFIELKKDGTIAGSEKGTWNIHDSNKLTLHIGTQTYEGVAVRQWDPATESHHMVFTALSKEGVSVWGSQTKDDGRTDKEIVSAAVKELTAGYNKNLIADIELPTEGSMGTSIKWSSSHPDILSKDGKVARPASGAKVEVVLTATVEKGNEKDEKEFKVYVVPLKVTKEEKIETETMAQEKNATPVWFVVGGLFIVVMLLVSYRVFRKKRG